MDVIRHNWGVAFRRLGGLTTGASTWPHTFDVQFIKVTQINISHIDCDTLVSNADKFALCDTMNILISDINQQNDKSLNNIDINSQTIKDMIPVRVTKSRNKRALLSFVSTIGKSLFGFAKYDDVKRISGHIKQMEEFSKITSQRVIQLRSQLKSLIVGFLMQ